jgi:hypothetical protein
MTQPLTNIRKSFDLTMGMRPTVHAALADGLAGQDTPGAGADGLRKVSIW